MKYEYKVIYWDVTIHHPLSIEEMLNNLGIDGWKLITQNQSSDSYNTKFQFILIRELLTLKTEPKYNSAT